jgi:hypothetical protein
MFGMSVQDHNRYYDRSMVKKRKSEVPQWTKMTIGLIVFFVLLIGAIVLNVGYFQKCAAHHGVVHEDTCYTSDGVLWPWEN